MGPDVRENFERAFSSGGAGSYRECECGAEFYNPNGGWDWEEGELERLEASESIAKDYSIATIFLDGAEYCMDCDCWVPKAEKVIAWLDRDGHSVAEFLSREKTRKQREAAASPVVKECSK